MLGEQRARCQSAGTGVGGAWWQIESCAKPVTLVILEERVETTLAEVGSSVKERINAMDSRIRQQ